MNKKTAIVLGMVILCLFQIKAQSNKDFKKQLYIGIGAGPIFTNIDFQPKATQNSRQAFFGGISARYISEKNLGLIGEINYTQRGWKEAFSNNPTFSYERTLNYVEMPIMTHIYFGNKVRFIINLGPQISFMLNNSSDMSSDLAADIAAKLAAATTDAEKQRIGPQYNDIEKKFDYGLIGGGGLEFHTGIGSFILEGRYYFGLGDIFNTKTEYYFSRAASRVIYGKLTYYIPFK